MLTTLVFTKVAILFSFQLISDAYVQMSPLKMNLSKSAYGRKPTWKTTCLIWKRNRNVEDRKGVLDLDEMKASWNFSCPVTFTRISHEKSSCSCFMEQILGYLAYFEKIQPILGGCIRGRRLMRSFIKSGWTAASCVH